MLVSQIKKNIIKWEIAFGRKKKGDGNDVRIKYLSFLFFNRKYKKIKKYGLICMCDVAEKPFFFSF